jgi:hypothetical protein
VSPVKYELGIYIPEDDILHNHRRENLKSYIALTGWTLQQRRNVSPVKYELGFISLKTTFFIVTAVETSNLTWIPSLAEVEAGCLSRLSDQATRLKDRGTWVRTRKTATHYAPLHEVQIGCEIPLPPIEEHRQLSPLV